MMKKWSVRLLSALCVAALLLGLVPMAALAAEPEHTLWIVGDSTVCDFGDADKALYYPRYGYGTQIANYLDGTYAIQNLALSGRSSKSFLTETNYTTLKDGIKAGDALIIGFGHNDEKADDPERYTSGTGDWQTEGSFAKSLYDNYVKLAQDKGAEAILCTPIVRRTAADAFKDSEVHVTAQGDYPAAVRKLGTDKNVAVVDLTAQTKALYEELKPAETLYLHSWTNHKEGSVDNTHLNIYGAKVVARMLASSLKDGSTELGKHVVLGNAPTKDADLVSNPDYVIKEYTSPTTASLLGEPYLYHVNADTVVKFRPTAFGDLGGAPVGETVTTPNHILETDKDGNMRIAVLNNKGKIASSTDGIAMFYVPVPVGKLVKLTATAKVNSIGTSNPQQGAFGLMARDDMYIDSNDKTIASDYVVAGTLGNGSTNCFYRKATKLNKTTALPEGKLAAGQSYELSLVGNPDGFTCTFDDQTPQSGGFDFALTTVDSDYYYVGMFCARNLDVTFSNITLEITGQATNPDLPDEPVIKDPDVPGPDEPGPDLPLVPTDAVAGGGLETLFAELPGMKAADVTAVKYAGAMTGSLAGDDLKYLVRDAALSGDKTGVRIDIPGLKAGKYTLTVTVGGVDYTAKDLEVLAHDRSGFAHQTVADDNTCTPYTEGVGAYNDDGTLKKDAVVLYVTDANKDTVTLTVGDKSLSGIGNILNTAGYKTNGPDGKEAPKILLELSRANKPLVVRIVGEVNAPKGVSPFVMGSSNGSMCFMKYAKNVTIEGIGPDATIKGWGISFSGDATDGSNWGKNFEVRNLSFKEVPEDCVEVTGSANKDGTIKEGVEHAWVHNCAFYRPTDIKNPAESDKVQGDGALDFKSGQYMTMSYNYFERNHKTSLVGGDDKQQQYHITWHHNWWKDVQSRAPLGRQADMHIYNNLYDGQTSYCMSLRAKVYIFSENNTFQGCKDVVIDEGTGGVCKSVGDVFTDCKGRNDAKQVAKDAKVDSANKFANFDTAAGSYVAAGKYKLDTVADAKKNVETWSGAMKAAASMTTVPMLAPGKPADKTELAEAIKDAEGVYALAKDVKILPAGTKASAVEKGQKFVTQDTHDALVKAIADAKDILDKAGATEEEVTKAVADLKAAQAAFKVLTGTKSTSSGGGGGSSSRPSSRPSTTTPTTKPASELFTDVAKDAWYESGVTYVVDKGLFKGVAEGVFAPNNNMTRAMLMTVLARLDGQNTEGGDTWYAKGMAWAMEKEISDGTMPESNITREQMVTMLYRYAKAGKAEGGLSAFVDGDSVSDWAKEAVTWAVNLGILKGKDGQRLDPQGTATRAEVATILQRFVEKTGK